MASPTNLREALIHECKDLLHAEKQLTKALPRMAKKATNPKLRAAFEKHAQETEKQVERMEQVIESLGMKATPKPCDGMKGIVEEGKETMQEVDKGDVLDAMLIGAAQKAEHYEIASYGTVCTWAELLGEKAALKLLKQNMSEEETTDRKLTELAESIINAEAMEEADA